MKDTQRNTAIISLPEESVPHSSLILSTSETTIVQKIKELRQVPVWLPECTHPIDSIPPLLSLGLSLAAIVFFGLALNDFKTGWYRWVFAIASFLVNFVRMLEVDQITLNRYLTYLKKSLHYIKQPEQLARELNIEPNWHPCVKLFYSGKKISYFILNETLKLTAVYYISDLLTALVEEVSWLNSAWFRVFLHLATMVTLEPSVHERLEDFHFPALTHYSITKQELKKFRTLVADILEQNKFILLNSNASCDLTRKKFLLETVESQNPASFWGFLFTTTPSGFYFSTKKQVAKIALSIFFILLYGMGESGNYKATWTDPDIDIYGRLGSIGGDFIFGVFLVLLSAQAVAGCDMKSFFAKEPENIFLVTFALLCAALTIPSGLSVAKEQQMPFWAGYVGMGAGTLFDNSTFLIEAIYKKKKNIVLKYAPTNTRFQQTVLETIYQKAEDLIQNEFTDNEFLKWLEALLIKQADLFNPYKPHIDHTLGWTKNKTLDEIIIAFKNPSVAMSIINQTGKFGLTRKLHEWLIAGGNAGIAGTLLWLHFAGIRLNESMSILVDVLTTLSRAGVVGMTRYNRHQHFRRSEQSESRTTPLLMQPISHTVQSFWCSHAGLSALLFMLGPLFIKYSLRFIAHWTVLYIFVQSKKNADVYSKIIGGASEVLGAGILSQHYLKQNRF